MTGICRTCFNNQSNPARDVRKLRIGQGHRLPDCSRPPSPSWHSYLQNWFPLRAPFLFFLFLLFIEFLQYIDRTKNMIHFWKIALGGTLQNHKLQTCYKLWITHAVSLQPFFLVHPFSSLIFSILIFFLRDLHRCPRLSCAAGSACLLCLHLSCTGCSFVRSWFLLLNTDIPVETGVSDIKFHFKAGYLL